MERGHSGTAGPFLDGALPRRPFSFLDIGCGNGWACRRAASSKYCVRATGIDSSPQMVRLARSRASRKESYETADISSWKTRRRFDFAFAMESMYYVRSPAEAAARVFGLLKPGGVFACGTDFYAENAATRGWARSTGLPMHLLSRRQWKRTLGGAGFEVRTRSARDASSDLAWKREMGTLFVVGSKRIMPNA